MLCRLWFHRFGDPDGYKPELDIDEAMFRAVLSEHGAK
jgi:hypothetical protein